MKRIAWMVVLGALAVSLSGCAVAEMLATGTTTGIEQGKADAAWARKAASDQQWFIVEQASLAAQSQERAARYDSDKADALARVAEAQNVALAEAHSFQLAQAEITSRLQSLEMFFLAQSQLMTTHTETMAVIANPRPAPETKANPLWTYLAVGVIAFLLGGIGLIRYARWAQG